MFKTLLEVGIDWEQGLEIANIYEIIFEYREGNLYEGFSTTVLQSCWFEKELYNHLLNEKILDDLYIELQTTTLENFIELDLVNQELQNSNLFNNLENMFRVVEPPYLNISNHKTRVDESFLKYTFQPDNQLYQYISIPQLIETLLDENIDYLQLETLYFYLQQSLYIKNNLLPYFIDDDEANYYYDQVQMNPWLWAVTQENLSLVYLTDYYTIWD